ncbi:MAG TPA: hypothetical protein VFR35_10160 [Actinoplanes sp.]|nr:hypothetical protein [Actinoplanes sp.]
MFTTMRRKRRSTKMRTELGQSVDHFKRAASLAAQETGATVGPRFNAAVDRMQPAMHQAKGAASSGWDSALATITPLVAAASDSVRHTGKETKKSAKASRTRARKNEKKLEKRVNQAMGRKQGGRRAGKLFGLALVGAALGAGAAYVIRRRQAAQWDEYDPGAPISSADSDRISSTDPDRISSTDSDRIGGADDAAFEPTPAAASNPTLTGTGDQTSSAQHSPDVARMARGGSKES